MSHPQTPDQVKLISSLFSPEKELIDRAIEELSKIFGTIDRLSPELVFDRTKYYAKEMGWPLHRRFITFVELVPPDSIVDIKLKTNELEKKFLLGENRRINIDPGYISPERMILATGKNYTHRVYLSKGIFADLTLVFQRGGFRTLKWTYPDYASPELIGFFNTIRKQYMEQLKEEKRLD